MEKNRGERKKIAETKLGSEEEEQCAPVVSAEKEEEETTVGAKSLFLLSLWKGNIINHSPWHRVRSVGEREREKRLNRKYEKLQQKRDP